MQLSSVLWVQDCATAGSTEDDRTGLGYVLGLLLWLDVGTYGLKLVVFGVWF